MSFLRFDDPYWEKYSGEKRIVKCHWCLRHFDLREILFAPVGNSRYYPMCQECYDNSIVHELSFKYPTDEQLRIKRRDKP
jgi:hypothetical protein